jgi:hypothetical protein
MVLSVPPVDILLVDQAVGLPTCGRPSPKLHLRWRCKQSDDVRAYGLNYQICAPPGTELIQIAAATDDAALVILSRIWDGVHAWLAFKGGTPGGIAHVEVVALFSDGSRRIRIIDLPIGDVLPAPPLTAGVLTIRGVPLTIAGVAINLAGSP